MKKKIFIAIKLMSITAVAATLSSVTANAANGDIAGTIYTTDILTQIDGKGITSYNIDGQTLIALEDLEQYGFNVKYDDSVRAVFINQTGECPSDFNPHIERGKVGGVAGSYYESDIKAFVNGQWINAYSLDGKMAASVEELGKISENSSYGTSPYLMSYTYDDSKRLLSLYTDMSKIPSADEIIAALKADEYGGFSYSTEKLELDGGLVVIRSMGGIPHGPAVTYRYISDDGLYLNFGNALSNGYKFRDYWGRITISNLTADGDCIAFDGTRWNGKTGKYRFNPRTCELTVIDEQYNADIDYELAESKQILFGRNAYVSNVKATVDGVPVTVYGLEGVNKNFIEADILEHSGYNIFECELGKVYMKASERDTSYQPKLQKPGEYAGRLFGSGNICINGTLEMLYRIDDKPVIDVDLWATEYGRDLPEYKMFKQFGTDLCGISGYYDADTNTVVLTTDGVHTDYKNLKETALHLYDDYDPNVKAELIADNDKFCVVKYTEASYEETWGYIITKSKTVINISDLLQMAQKFECNDDITVDGNTVIMKNTADNDSVRFDVEKMCFVE